VNVSETISSGFGAGTGPTAEELARALAPLLRAVTLQRSVFVSSPVATRYGLPVAICDHVVPSDDDSHEIEYSSGLLIHTPVPHESASPTVTVPETLGIVVGRGVYPGELPCPPKWVPAATITVATTMAAAPIGRVTPRNFYSSQTRYESHTWPVPVETITPIPSVASIGIISPVSPNVQTIPDPTAAPRVVR
jgi:hypothetical protein